MWKTLRQNPRDLPSHPHILGKFKDEIPENHELLAYTSLGPKNYDLQIGTIEYPLDEKKFKATVTQTNVRCKGLSLKHENAKGLISSTLMRDFIYALAEQEKREIKIPQQRFEIQRNCFKIRPLNYFKTYNNENLLQKRLYNTDVSLSNTYPIGAVAYYD